MTTARERYEQKTKVVTFRVSLKDYDYLEEIKAKSGLSYADLIKLGAGIAQEEIKAKLADISGLKGRLAELKSSVEQEQQGLSESLDKERRRWLKELDTEMKVFKLFDRGWRVETVGYKLGIPQGTARHYFMEWARERKDKQAIERELLGRCLKKHINRLKEQKAWAAFRYGRSAKEDLERLGKQLEDCWHLLSAPEEMSKEDKEFLIAEYSSNL